MSRFVGTHQIRVWKVLKKGTPPLFGSSDIQHNYGQNIPTFAPHTSEIYNQAWGAPLPCTAGSSVFFNVLIGFLWKVSKIGLFLTRASEVHLRSPRHAQWYGMMNWGWNKHKTALWAPKTHEDRDVSSRKNAFLISQHENEGVGLSKRNPRIQPPPQ